MSNIAIRVEDLGKQYRIGMQATRYHTLRDAICRCRQTAHPSF